MAITQPTGRVPPAAALQAQLANLRAAVPLMPLLYRPTIGALIDTFAAYVAATEGRLDAQDKVLRSLSDLHP